MVEHINTIIIGAGQSGLSVSYCLKQYGREHVIFDQADHPASAWGNRWDSFTLVTPNWMTHLPGAPYQGDDPDGFMDREEISAHIQAYSRQFELPIQFRTKVISVKPTDAGYWVKTDRGEYQAENVVIAVGFYQQPKTPAFSHRCAPGIHQIHSSQYKNPSMLPDGAVLVVGSAQSGSQIAEELNENGRKVYLSVSTTGRFPRRYRGKDAAVWMKRLGYFNRTVDQLPSSHARFAASAHGTGKNGGHTINMHQFAQDGIVLLGRVQAIEGNRTYLASDLKENLAKADQFEREFVDEIDHYIKENKIDCPQETLPHLEDGFKAEEIDELELDSKGIRNIIWATGYRSDFSWVSYPIIDKDGLPVHHRGVTQSPGLYVIGLPFLYSGKSGLLYGAAEDAAYIASAIVTKEKVPQFTQ